MHTNFWTSTTAPDATTGGTGYKKLIWYNTTNNTAYRYDSGSNTWITWATQGNGGGGGVVEINYTNLKALYDAGTLTSGQLYLITDYRTIYKQPDTSIIMGKASADGGVNPSQIYQLLVLATSTSTIANEAFVTNILNDDGTVYTNYVPECQQWKVWYQIENSSLYSWATSEGKGVIYRLIDHKGNDLPYDFYNIRFRLYAPAASTYQQWISDNASTYAQYTIVKGDTTDTINQLYVRIRNKNTNAPSAIVSSAVNDWKLMLDTTSHYIPQAGIVTYYDGSAKATISADTTTYADYLTFNSTAYENVIEATYDDDTHKLYTNVFMAEAYNNHFGAGMRDNVFYSTTHENQISINYKSNYITSDFYQNTIGINCSSNTILTTAFYGNTIGNKFMRNSLGFKKTISNSQINYDIRYNQIGNNCNCNAILHEFAGNAISNSFASNYIDITFKYNQVANNYYQNSVGNNFQYNTIGSDFHNNTIGCNFVNNTIANDFYSNKIGNDMKRNTVGNRCISNTIGDYCKMNNIESSFKYSNLGNSFSGCTLGHGISLEAGDNLHFVNIPTQSAGDSQTSDPAGEESYKTVNLTSRDVYGKDYTIFVVNVGNLYNETTQQYEYKVIAYYYDLAGVQTFLSN